MRRLAAEKLIHMIEHPKTTLIDRDIVPGHLIEGSSVAMREEPQTSPAEER